MEYKDYYKTLGVNKDASADEIKKQYRRLARKYHPDVSKEANAEEKFKEVKEAYEVLKDTEKRQAYDQLGAQPQGAGGFQPPPGWTFNQGGDSSAGAADFSDFFENLFGRGQARQGQRRGFKQRGQDLHSKIQVTLEEAFKGGQRVLNLQEPVIDPQTHQQYMQTRQLNVKIPAGVTAGQQIRLKGQGGKGMGGADGDLYLEINIAPHKHYTINGKDVNLNLPVTPWEAALGGKVKVPTLAGTVDLNIPAGSQTGQKMRLRGRGLPGKTAGDQYVILKIYIPEPKNDQQRELYQQMSEQMQFNPREGLLAEGQQWVTKISAPTPRSSSNLINH